MMFWDAYFYKAFPGYSSILPLWESIASRFEKSFPLPEDFNQIAKDYNMDLTFVVQEKAMSYEKMIFADRKIPMRLNLWHDFFNNLTWLSFPNIKWAITTRYLKEKAISQNLSDKKILNQNEHEKRAPRQNLLAHFDECGVVICSSKPEYFDMVKQHEWKSFFCETKDLLQVCEPFIIGHGLFEKCLSPYIGITGKVLFLAVDQFFFSLSPKEKITYIDTHMAEMIESDTFPDSPRSLQPFPLLGWSGWHENQSTAFYENRRYFRPLTKNI